MTKPNIKTIDVHQLKEMMANNPNLCLIDVRELEEWQEFHISGALHIPKDIIASSIAATIPNKDQPIYLHCKGGVRSLFAAQSLMDLGYQEVYSVDGGIIDWAMSGYPIEQQKTSELQL
ncbi:MULTISPECIES: rhodanese-like domain-containing protein [Legionella]|uniref:Rhodanese-like domain-containing protein n=1 Tax=Legionella resiliens TaxID=2905958 RepID=A0ABS8X4L0_9GAMM|nr:MULTISPECIES: rhodanese-like domain-containing protein [unclassified Legionella]MCE0723302.1 rhodanese-like domain-containing protein [Legionella sp. 9fVS26]MCE3532455.1 rhodanese-like domain-containing protein [Legionella sp. 8cVS16]QLZ68595.1 sulfurtransferase [Legionella sp. PC1000]